MSWQLTVVAAVALCGCITDPSLNVVHLGEGSGTVVSDPAGIECGHSCAMLVTGPLTLRATAAAGSRFVGWSNACEGQPADACVPALDSDITVAAEFAPVWRQLAVATVGAGRVTSADRSIDCGDKCITMFRDRDSLHVALHAIPSAGSELVRWDGAPQCGNQLDCTVTLDNDHVVTAVFVARRQIVVALYGNGHGRVTSTPAAIDCPGTCTASFDLGTPITLTATPSSGSTFLRWSSNTSCTDATCTLMLPGDAGSSVVVGPTFWLAP